MATGAVSLSVRFSTQWRDSRGRFARPPVGESLDRNLHALGQDAVRLLADATPVRTGAMRSNWRSTLVPSLHQVRIFNSQSYAPYVVWGTSRQRANAALQDVIRQQLPARASVTADKMLKDIAVGLKG